jgi:hypothetical protein
MQNTRESSVLRSLAVAFGDGLAFGVGMKLSQRPSSASGPAALPQRDLTPLMERIAEIEKRMAELGRGAARAIAAGGAPFDQKVLEAVVAALDARLNEQAGHTESRVTQLEARLAIELKSLHQQGDSAGAAVEERIQELIANFDAQIAALRPQAEEAAHAESTHRHLQEVEDRLAVELQSLNRQDESLESLLEKRIDELSRSFEGQIAALRRQADEDRQAGSAERLLSEMEARLAIELQSLHRQDESLESHVEKRIDELSSNFDIQIAALRKQADEDRHAIRSEMIAMHREFAEEAARAVERRVEEEVGRYAAVLRAELEHKDDQIAELRDVIFGFAQACRALTERPASRARQESEPEPYNVQVLPDRRAV